MTNKRLVCTVFILLAFFNLVTGEQYTKLKNTTVNFEIEVSNVDVIIRSVDNLDSIEYFAELPSGRKLSCVENRGTFRVRSLYKTDGRIQINVPKGHLFERIRITSSLADIHLENIQAVNTVVVSTRGTIDIVNCTFKTSNIVQNTGELNVKLNVLRASAICINYVTASITFVGHANSYYMDYGQGFSTLNLEGEVLIPPQGIWGNKKARKRTIISAGNSTVNINFADNQEKSQLQ